MDGGGSKRVLSLKELLKIVSKPANKIGNGGFGDVYKGTLQNGNVVAVKKLKKQLSRHEGQFRNEFKILQGLEHTNIVRLLDYFEEEKLLCYEYITNGSLDKYINDESIGWDNRFKIIKGICLGLCYLHDSRPHDPVVHLDLKPENILLDTNMIPKIADFGLSMLFDEDQTRHIVEHIAGPLGYMAPEYTTKGAVSVKCDIFSFGILILEVVTGKVVPKDEKITPTHQYIRMIRSMWYECTKIRSMYPSVDDSQLDEVKGCITIGIKCLAVDPRNRPTAVEINNMLCGMPILEGNRISYSKGTIVLPARALQIEHSDNEECWLWDAHGSSWERAFLKEVWHFYISGNISTKDLTRDATYRVYLLYKLSPYQSGFDSGQRSEIRLSNGRHHIPSRMDVCIDPAGCVGESSVMSYPRTTTDDGWMELKLGEFVNSFEIQGGNNSVVVQLSEKSNNYSKVKKGLIIDSMEFRPE